MYIIIIKHSITEIRSRIIEQTLLIKTFAQTFIGYKRNTYFVKIINYNNQTT